jgi:hypothetical protein
MIARDVVTAMGRIASAAMPTVRIVRAVSVMTTVRITAPRMSAVLSAPLGIGDQHEFGHDTSSL